jgi:hypothetical protein
LGGNKILGQNPPFVRSYLHAHAEALQAEVKVGADGALDADAVADVLCAVVAMIKRALVAGLPCKHAPKTMRTQRIATQLSKVSHMQRRNG